MKERLEAILGSMLFGFAGAGFMILNGFYEGVFDKPDQTLNLMEIGKYALIGFSTGALITGALSYLCISNKGIS